VTAARARAWLLLLAAALIVALRFPGPPAPEPSGVREALTEASRHDGFYSAAADLLRGGGRPVALIELPMPAVPVLRAALPPWTGIAGAWILAAGVFVACRTSGGPGGRADRAARNLLLLVVLAAYLVPGATAVPESWAGLLAAASAGRGARGHWVQAVALGLAAAVTSPLALPVPAAAAAVALWRGRSREAMAWAMAAAAGALAFALHLDALARLAPVDGALLPHFTPAGPGTAVEAVRLASPLALLPPGAAVPPVVTALWTAWRLEPAAAILLCALLIPALLVPAAAMPYCGYVAALLLLPWLAASPRALRATWAEASARRRRIRVTRVVR